jgi:hypothetical protein
MPRNRRSRWRNDATWTERLWSDREFLQHSIGNEGMEALGQVVQAAADDLGAPDYLVVFGSRAVNVGQDASDVDMCFEASWVPPDPDRMVRIRERQQDLVFDLLGWPRGLLLGRLRVDDQFAHRIAREGRVYADDDGWYRNTLIVADEEGLLDAQ